MVSNRLKNDASDNRKKHLAKLAIVLKKYFAKWSLLPGSNQVTREQVLVYLEALRDLSVEQLEYGCREAGKNAERFPWPGHIRKFALQYNALETQMLGPKQLQYNEAPLTKEDKAQAAEDSAKLRKLLEPIAKMPEDPTPLPPEPEKPFVAHPPKSLDLQLQELRKKGWLQ